MRAGGERERRSNRERRGSGSVWSKRDRFVLRRSESSIAQRSRGIKLAIGDRLSTAKVAMLVRVVADSLRCCAPSKVMKSAGGSRGSSKLSRFRDGLGKVESHTRLPGWAKDWIQCGIFLASCWSHCNGAFEPSGLAPRRSGARKTIYPQRFLADPRTPGFGGLGV